MELEPVKCCIPDLLLRNGKDQHWLVIETGLPKQRISDYCTLRKVMNLRTAVIIARSLKCLIEELYEWE